MVAAIIKSVGGALVKQQGKKLAADKLMGRGGKKRGNIQKSTPKNEVVSNIMGRKIGGDKEREDIPASQQTINVSALRSDAPVGSGGSGDIAIIQDISVAVSSIAESMKRGLVLKEKANKKKRLQDERDKRAAQEADIEKPDKPKGNGMPKFKIPKIGLLDGIFGFLTKFLFGALIMKLIDFANSPLVKGIISVVAVVGKVILSTAEFLFKAFTSLVDFGYKLVEGAERIVGKIFGEEGAKKFATFMENIKPLINAFLVWKIIGKKIFTSIIQRIRGAFNLIKGILKRGFKIFNFLTRGVAGKAVTGLKNIATKGLTAVGSKIGGFAAKIFGKSAGVIGGAFKSAKPFVSKFFGKIPIVGPLVVGIVSLLSGEPASQAIFKTMGAALGGVAGSFIPIPILGTLIGETIGVFVGDLFYELIFGRGMEGVGQKLKDTFKTFIEPVFNFFKDGIGRFFSNFPMIDIPAKFGIQTALGKLFPFMANAEGLVTSFPNLGLFVPGPGSIELIKHMGASFMPGIFGDKSESKKEEVKLSGEQTTKGKDVGGISSEASYESGEGSVAYIPVPVVQIKEVPIKNKRGRITGYKKVPVDPDALALYGGK